MKPIKIMTDSLSDIPKELVKEYDIIVLPLTVRFGKEEFKDGVDMKGDTFYNRLRKDKQLPATSQVPPNEFMMEMEKAVAEGYEVIVINGSSQVSGTYQSAVMAKNLLDEEGITVIDSLGLSYSCGMMVVEAAKMACEGKSKEEIIDKIFYMKERMDLIFSVETLEYLKKGGRLSPTKATIGTLLNIKPILAVENGVVEPLDKVRGSKKVISKMIELAKSRGIKVGCKKIGIAHGANLEGMEKLRIAVEEAFEPKEIVSTEIGCTIGTHTGPGILGIFYLKEM